MKPFRGYNFYRGLYIWIPIGLIIWSLIIGFAFGADLQININDLTLEQLKTNRPDLVEMIKTEEETTAIIQVEQDEQKRTKRFAEETKDTEGDLISKRVDDYAYYPSGCVDTIELKVYDNRGSLISKKTIKHFEDGRQPIEQ